MSYLPCEAVREIIHFLFLNPEVKVKFLPAYSKEHTLNNSSTITGTMPFITHDLIIWVVNE